MKPNSKFNYKEIFRGKWAPIILAVAAGLVVLIYYIVSGRGSLDNNVRTISNDPAIKTVDTNNPQHLVITCKNGQVYKISFNASQPNYDDLIFNACGEDGTENSGTQI